MLILFLSLLYYKPIIMNLTQVSKLSNHMHTVYHWSLLIIIDNESIPIVFSIGPSEKSELYSNFSNFIKEIDKNAYDALKLLPLLSDKGSALKNFSSVERIQNHFFCFFCNWKVRCPFNGSWTCFNIIIYRKQSWIWKFLVL